MVVKGKVLFIVHDVYQDFNHFPSGVGYLAAVLKNYGAEVKIYNQDVFHYTNDQLERFLQKEHFDLIGIGFLAARFKETIEPLCNIVNQYKKNAWLVLGGHGPSPIPKYILKETDANIVAIGECEDTIVDLLRCKTEHGNLSKIKGIAYKEGDEIYVNERRKPIRDLDTLPFPEWSLFPMEEYTTCIKYPGMDDQEKILAITTSRGCINRCTFCYRMEKGIRFRSVKNVAEEIIFLKENYGVTFFYMLDELFTYPRKRMFEFHDELEKNDLKIKYRCSARVDVIDEEVAQVLKESGCQFLNFGMESSDQRVLDLMNKNITVEQNIQAAEIARKVGIGFGLNFIWGNIGDTEESLKNNVKMIKKYNLYHQLRTIRPVTPYPGSELYYQAIDRGLLSGPKDFFKKFKNSDLMLVNFTDIPEDRFYKFLFEANKELIKDHYENTTKDMDKAQKLINDFRSLYFEGKIRFRGARRYSTSK